MKPKFLLTSFLLLTFFNQTYSQNRVDRPLQVQANLSGVFLKTVGPALADSEVDDLQVQNWGWPGLSLGYHLNRAIYVGYSFQPNRNLILKESWGFTTEVKDGNITVDHNSGAFHNFDIRISPFKKLGLFGAVSYTHITEADYSMEFRRTGPTMIIGNNSYDTDMDVQWNFKSLGTLALGLGYTWIHQSGLSFTMAIQAPLASGDFYENIRYTQVNANELVSNQDLELAEERLQDEMFYYPVQLSLNVGYNFAGF